MQIKEIEDAWSSISKKYTDGITDVIIDHVQEDIGGGWYEGGSGIVADIYIANGSVVGSASTLHHEVHHHMWSIKRSYLKKIKFRKGVQKLMNKYGKSTTKYSDSYGKKKGMLKLKKQQQMLVLYVESISNNTPTIELANLEYVASRNTAKRNVRIKKTASKACVNVLNLEEAKLDRIVEEYDSLPDEEKMNLVKKNHEILKKKLDIIGPAKYSEQFYEEIHSEIGAFINAEESMRTCARLCSPTTKPEWDYRINDDVIDKYADLYMEVFG